MVGLFAADKVRITIRGASYYKLLGCLRTSFALVCHQYVLEQQGNNTYQNFISLRVPFGGPKVTYKLLWNSWISCPHKLKYGHMVLLKSIVILVGWQPDVPNTPKVSQWKVHVEEQYMVIWSTLCLENVINLTEQWLGRVMQSKRLVKTIRRLCDVYLVKADVCVSL